MRPWASFIVIRLQKLQAANCLNLNISAAYLVLVIRVLKFLIWVACAALALASVIFTGNAVNYWIKAGDLISNSNHYAELEATEKDQKNSVEEIIAIIEFGPDWKQRSSTCYALEALIDLARATQENNPYNHLANQVARDIVSQQRVYPHFERHFITATVSCRLERDYSASVLLRVFLDTAYFGNGEYGLSTAARSIFNKNVSELGYSESVQIAALLKSPQLRNSPEQWKKTAEGIMKSLSDKP